MTALLAIDPGTDQSGFVVLEADGTIDGTGVVSNNEILTLLDGWVGDVAIERFEARGMSLADDSIVTILWTGRFMQAVMGRRNNPFMVKRSEVKSFLCGTQKAKDPNVRAALIDIYGPPGKKSAPGPTFGVTSHAWGALGVAATVRGMERA